MLLMSFNLEILLLYVYLNIYFHIRLFFISYDVLIVSKFVSNLKITYIIYHFFLKTFILYLFVGVTEVFNILKKIIIFNEQHK